MFLTPSDESNAISVSPWRLFPGVWLIQGRQLIWTCCRGRADLLNAFVNHNTVPLHYLDCNASPRGSE
jgi:hypothetical protein